MTFLFWQRLLMIATLGGILFGLFLPLLSTIDAVAGGYNHHLSNAFFHGAPLSEEMKRYNLWVWAMLGAVIMAWGITLFMLACYPFARREPWSWISIASSLGVAFVMNVGVSLYFGFYAEGVLVLGWFLPVAIPLACTYKAFFHQEVG